MMKATGFFMTESSGHLSEYLPYFRTREDLLQSFGGPGFRGERGTYLKLCLFLQDINTSLMNAWASGATPVDFSKVRSVEFAAPLMNAKVTGKPVRIAGNVLNKGLIENLPYGCCVEVPVFVDHLGLHPAHVGRLPELCSALCRSNVAFQELAVKAALEGDREAAFHACLVDPLTAASLAPHEIRNMVDELFAAQEKWLPQFQGQTNPAQGHTIGRQATSDYVIVRGKAMLEKWDPRAFNADNLPDYL
jgi:alpha-galactosidase